MKRPIEKPLGKRIHQLPKDVKKFLKLYSEALRSFRVDKKGWKLEETEEHGYQNWRHWQAVETSKGEMNVTLATLYNQAKALGIHPSKLIENIPVDYL